jgi:hypothetical protein
MKSADFPFDPELVAAVEELFFSQDLVNAVTELFLDINLDELTRTVLNDTPPAQRLGATRAIDDLFGHVPHWDAQDGEL